METLRHLCLAIATIAVIPSPAWASPAMIRAGYRTCAACHLSPQGGGLLTDYGKGIDKAQSLRSGQYEPRQPDRRFRHDVRALLVRNVSSSQVNRRSPDPLWTQVSYRHALWLTRNTRLSYSGGVEGAAVSAAGVSSRPRPFVSRALWEYRARQGLEIALGRDALPDGLGVADRDPLFRRGIAARPGGYPTQAKLFLWTDRFELVPYLFAPDGSDVSGTGEHGAGVLAGLNIGKRAVAGVSARLQRAGEGSGEAVGVYARLGFGRWGVLAQHEFGDEHLPSNGSSGRYAGYSQVFAAPYEWLVTSVTLERLRAFGDDEIRLRPEVQLRATNNLTVIFSIRNDLSPEGYGRIPRVYLVQFAIKEMQ